MNAVEVAWTLAMLVLPYALAVVAFKAGTDYIARRTDGAGFVEDFTVDAEHPEVVEYVEAVDAGMRAASDAR